LRPRRAPDNIAIAFHEVALDCAKAVPGRIGRELF
jgi:hypothetical protein